MDTQWHCAPLQGLGNLDGVALVGRSRPGQGSLNRLKRPELITQGWAMLDKMRKQRALQMSEKRTGHHLLWGYAATWRKWRWLEGKERWQEKRGGAVYDICWKTWRENDRWQTFDKKRGLKENRKATKKLVSTGNISHSWSLLFSLFLYSPLCLRWCEAASVVRHRPKKEIKKKMEMKGLSEELIKRRSEGGRQNKNRHGR